MITGIYKIVNTLNNKVYIGQSLDIPYRWGQHLKANDNTELHQAFQHQPLETFIFSIVELCEPSLLDEKEQYWIKKYNSLVNGYNMTTGGKVCQLDPQMNLARKPVNQYSLAGELIATFSSVKDAVTQTGINKIADVCRGERQTAGGYQWKFVTDCNEQKIKPNTIKNQPRPVKQYSLAGDFLALYPSVSEAARKINITSSAISKVCSKEGFSAGGYRWSYDNEDLDSNTIPAQGTKKQVAQISLETNEIIATYESASAAARALGKKSSSTISDACRGKLKTAYKYKWNFI